MLDLQSYLRGKGRNVPLKKGRLDLTSYMLGKAASGGGIREITGTLPLTVRSRASQVLKNYRFYGTASGAGVETENLFDASMVFEAGYINNAGDIVLANSMVHTRDYIPIKNSSQYVLTGKLVPNSIVASVAMYDTQKKFITRSVGSMGQNRIVFTTADDCSYIRFSVNSGYNNFYYDPKTIMLTPGSTAPSSYIPHGYKLPLKVTSNGTTTDYPIYIGDSKLGGEEYVDYESGKIWKQYGELTLKGNEDNLHYYGLFEGVNAFYIDLLDNQQLVAGSPYLWCNHYEVKEQIRPALDKSCRYQSPSSDPYTWNIGRIYFFDNDYASLSEYRTHLAELYDANTPLKVRYLLKEAPVSIDPPVPLPDITLPQGEVTIDIDGDPKPQATIKGKITQIA